MQALNPLLTAQAASVLAHSLDLFRTSLTLQGNVQPRGLLLSLGGESQALLLGLEARGDSLHLLFSSTKTRVIFYYYYLFICFPCCQ